MPTIPKSSSRAASLNKSAAMSIDLVLGLVGWILSAHFHGSTWTVVWSTLVFGILNTVLKPVLKL